MHKLAELTPRTVVKLLTQTRSVNDRQRAVDFAIACEADARGRTGLEARAYPQTELFLRFQRAANSVDAAAIAAQYSDGETIKQKLHQARCAAIKSVNTSS